MTSVINMALVSRTTSMSLSYLRPLIISSSRSELLQQQSKWCTMSRRCQQTEPRKKQLTVKKMDDKKFSELTMGEKVVRSGKDAGYGFVVIAGIGVTGVMFYMIGRELLSSESSSGVYGKTLKLLKKNDQIYDTFGEPLKGYGEMTRRGRRRYVNHVEWLDDQSRKHMRMKFYIEGSSNKGTVHLEVKQNEAGKFEYRYLFVEIDNSHRTIVIEDNR